METNIGQSFSLLIVENNPDFLCLLKQALEQEVSIALNIDNASSASEALQKFKDNPYQLVLVEMDLDDKNGLELIHEALKIKKDVPLVLMVSKRDPSFEQTSDLANYSDLIIKSECQFQDIPNRLKKFFDSAGIDSSPTALRDRRKVSSKPTSCLRESFPLGRNIQDELTGLYNHGYLQERVQQEFQLAVEKNYSIGCLMIDIDHFSTYNESRGYGAGDKLLKECGRLILNNCRLTDFCARYGGEEFAVLLLEATYENAKAIADRMRDTIAKHLFVSLGDPVSLTVSIGVSSYPGDGQSEKCELLSYAQRALYRSKTGGRNKVMLYKDIVPAMNGELPHLKISDDKILEFQKKLSEVSDSARRSYLEASKTLIVALETKDRFTAGHGASCAKYSIQVALAMGLSEEDAEVVGHGALLHDIGKLCIPDSILLKPGKLTFSEYETMKQHPYFGYKILKPIKFFQEEAVVVLHHHEWFNGEGYPCRLKGNEIPLGARIVAVVDSYDTIRIAGGRYKKTMTVEETVNELVACSGNQFDPQVVKAFISVLKDRRELLTDNYNKEQLESLIQKNAA